MSPLVLCTEQDCDHTDAPGYTLGLMMEAAILHQAATPHRDPVHITVHYLRVPARAILEIRVRVLKVGKGLTNLLVDLVQNGKMMIMTHMIFGVLAPPPTDPPATRILTLEPPHPKARRTPMQTHPSKCTHVPDTRYWLNNGHFIDAHDPVYVARAKSDAEGLQWGTYMTLTSEQGPLRPSMIPFLADSAMGLVESMGTVQEMRKRWFPTITLTIEFKFPIPSLSSADHSPRTVALFSSGSFVNDPQARHDNRVELWTAPSDIGVGEVREGWRETQRCLAVANCVMMVVPAVVGTSKVKGAKL
ncbi:hypothetical protein A0H81_00070 [Grifola frondosa]|uniref:Acyl-CoA thioesterase-like N-terminal HotDog domain-containing protein n=1 Tax=Grifola frondosa TaxID=5627 RepID=A0A1C7MSQ3_GRIFR|nr:hypothetical protein A0H81_00070 [Grifola frondosa]